MCIMWLNHYVHRVAASVQAQRKAQGAGMPSMVEALRLQDDVEEAAEAESSGACTCMHVGRQKDYRRRCTPA